MMQEPPFTALTDTITDVDTPGNFADTSNFVWDGVGKDNGITASECLKAFDGDPTKFFVCSGAGGGKTTYTFPSPVKTTQITVCARHDLVGESKYGVLIDTDAGEIALTQSGQFPNGGTVVNSYQGLWQALSGFTEVRSIIFTSNDAKANHTFSGVQLSDSKVVGAQLIVDGPQTTLTFATDKDIELFNPGDVVQYGSSNSAWDETQIWSTSTNFNENSASHELAFDGNTNTFAYGDSRQPLIYTFTSPVTGTVRVFIDPTPREVEITTNFGDTFTTTTADWVDLGNQTNLSSISIVRHDIGNPSAVTTPILNAVELNGKILVDPTTFVTVISTDPDNSKMVVDGGSWWDGSNGDPDGDTNVTKTLQGSGKYLSHGYKEETGTIVTDTIEKVDDIGYSFTFTGFEKSPGFTPPVDIDSGTYGWASTNYNYSPIGANLEASVTTATPFALAGDNVKTFQYGNPGEDITNKRHQLVLDDGTILEADSVTGTSTTQHYYYEFVIPSGRKCSEIKCLSGSVAGTRAIIFGVMLNDLPLEGTFSLTELTLTTDLNLDKFEPGDKIGAYTGFKPVLYKGTGTTQEVDIGMPPGLVWIKSRTTAAGHSLYDTLRGAPKVIGSDTTDKEIDNPTGLSSFLDKGFELGTATTENKAGDNFVAWCWDSGGNTVTNNDGTIESQVQSTGSFSIVKWVGDGDSNASVGHGLDDTPAFVIMKNLDGTQDWPVYHKDAEKSPGYDDLYLNEAYKSGDFGVTFSSVDNEKLTGGPYLPATNNLIAYCWSEVPGGASFGKYTGTSALLEVDLGFRPSFLMIKGKDIVTQWFIFDNARNPGKVQTHLLAANLNEPENGSSVPDSYLPVEFTDTGFRYNGGSSDINLIGYEYLYMAFAESSPNTVLGVDVDSTKMFVDGGSYEGSDGSGTAGGDTTVQTTKEYNVSGNYLTLTDSNEDWWIGGDAKSTVQFDNAPSKDVVFKSSIFETDPPYGTEHQNSIWSITYPDGSIKDYNAGPVTSWNGPGDLANSSVYTCNVTYVGENGNRATSDDVTFETSVSFRDSDLKLYYDENTDTTLTFGEIKAKLGINESRASEFGYYEVDDVDETKEVIHYVKIDSKYKPVYDYTAMFDEMRSYLNGLINS